MKKSALLLLALVAGALTVSAQSYKGTKSKIDFFSTTPMENISATDTVATTILNAKTGDVVALISIKGFVFPNSLMQEHFNENYMESDKFPKATFSGKIQETIDYGKDGVYPVTMVGKLTVHGVAQDRTIKGTLTVKGGTVIIDCKFDIKLEDHQIKVPEAVGQKIAESINVTVHSELSKLGK